MKLTTAGESHGKALVAIVEGVPARLKIDFNAIGAELALRRKGYGRGARQKLETDRVEILSGVRDGGTLGTPISLCIWNNDYENWSTVMDVRECDQEKRLEKAVTRVRPGHADLAGAVKFGWTDARNVLERASARETAIRVAAGSVFKQYLSALGVEIAGYVRSVGFIEDGKEYSFDELKSSKNTELGILDSEISDRAKTLIDDLKKDGDTAGGVAEIRVRGLKCGFGSYATYSEKLDARLAAALISIQSVKGVEFGAGFSAARLRGSLAHDEIGCDGEKFYRYTNRAGGIEGGVSNGEEIVIRVAAKPIPTLLKGLKTVDIRTREEATAATERSDVCAIFALEVIAEAVVAEVIANSVSERLGGDTIERVIRRYNELP